MHLGSGIAAPHANYALCFSSASEALLDATCAMLTIPHALEAGSYIARVQGSHDTPVYLDVYGVQPVTLSVLNP